MAQVSEGFSYQSVVRDASGNLLYNQLIGLRMTLLANSALGTADYVETHQVATNGYGVVSISVGTGTVVSGVFNNVDWINNTYFLKTELDVSGGTNYVFMGISQILAVPYALHAQTASSVLGDNDTSATNEIQQLSIVGNQLVLDNGGNSVTLSGTIDLDADPTNELQALNISNDTLYLSQGNYVLISDYLQSLSNTAGTISISGNNTITLADSSSTNEIQQLSIAGNDITISEANTITLPTNNDNDPINELQNLNISGNSLSISNGNSVTLPPDGDNNSSNEIQSLSLSNNNLSISASNSVTLPTNNDNSTTNEIQSLSLNNNSLSISNGNSVNLPINNDNSSTNELQTLSNTSGTISISNGNTINLEDSSATNELQTLSYNNDTLSISNGNQVTINTSCFDFIFPDGKSGITPITITAGDTSQTNLGFSPSIWPTFEPIFNRSFTVPPGKSFYITSFYNEKCTGGSTNTNSTQCYGGNLRINSFDVFSGNAYNDLYSLIMFNQPLILGSGDNLSIIPSTRKYCHYSICEYIPGLSNVNGFLVDSKIIPKTIEILNSNNYTVPAGKILVVLNIYNSGNLTVNSKQIFLNSNKFNKYEQGGSSSSHGSNTWLVGYSLIMPLFFNENDVLSSSNQNTMIINGYLIDK